jgi:N-methylhydantoinase B
MASGTGARDRADGIDSGGFLRSISCVVANAEHYEARFPLLYLWRRHEPDTGGPGRRRGGVGVGFAVVPHRVESIPAVIPHFGGTLEPESAGLFGGYPGATNAVRVVRSSSVRTALADGRIPQNEDDLGGIVTRLPGVAQVALARDDVLVTVTTGGGGWGDPLERDPASVASDVRAGLVSGTSAAELYGVVLDGTGGSDDSATRVRRAAIRQRRSTETGRDGSLGAGVDGLRDGIDLRPGRSPWLACPRCGTRVAVRRGARPRDALASTERPLRAAGPHVAPGVPDHGFVLVERYCPGCLRLVEVERSIHAAKEERP